MTWPASACACGGDTSSPIVRSYVLAPLQKGRWYDFVLHVKWSASASVGFVEMWINGNRVVPKIFTPTLYAGMTAYAKQGYYRSPHTGTTVVYQDGMRRGLQLRRGRCRIPLSSSPPLSVTSSIATGSTLSGSVPWTATPSGKTASSVTFSVDDEVVGDGYDGAVHAGSGHHEAREHVVHVPGRRDRDRRYQGVGVVDGDSSEPRTSHSDPEPLGRADGQRLGPWTATTSGRTVSKVDFSVNGQVVATDSTAPYAQPTTRPVSRMAPTPSR